MTRNVFYASVLGLDLGMFYKRRDYSTIINGRNPIVAHEYIGASVEGMNVFVADDMIATGDSILKLAKEIKEKGAKRFSLLQRSRSSPKVWTNLTKHIRTACLTQCFRQTSRIVFRNSKSANGLWKRICQNIFLISSPPQTSTNPLRIFSIPRKNPRACGQTQRLTQKE